YEFGARDPKSVVRITLERHCINKTIGVMHQKRFFKKLNDGRYALMSNIKSESECVLNENKNNTDDVYRSILELYSLASLQKDRVKKEIIEYLRGLTAEQFEDFCRIFLIKYGFLEMKLTKRGRDGGVDVSGLLRVGLASMRVAVQCKKYAAENKIGRSMISAFRGDITGEFEQGIFITTSSYTKEALEISFKPSCVPVVLIDGEQLADFMIDKRIGVQRELIEIYDFEQDLLWD
ncbi:restriction endonuclease, partial [Salmonella enterica]|nr:restriction endonuclease [Salmonella enterica]